MAETFLEIIDFNRRTFEGKVTSVTLPAVEGELTILAHHLPMVTPLKAGEVMVREGNKEHYFAIDGGFLVVQKDKITILVDSSDSLEELNEEKILEAKAKAGLIKVHAAPAMKITCTT